MSPVLPTRLAWTSLENKIRIVELKSKQEFANFDGVKLKERGFHIFYFPCLIMVSYSPVKWKTLVGLT